MTNEEIVAGVPDRVRELRGDRTIEEMAEAAGVDWNTWWRYEHGKIRLVTAGLVKVANALGVTVCIFDEDEAA